MRSLGFTRPTLGCAAPSPRLRTMSNSTCSAATIRAERRTLAGSSRLDAARPLSCRRHQPVAHAASGGRRVGLLYGDGWPRGPGSGASDLDQPDDHRQEQGGEERSEQAGPTATCPRAIARSATRRAGSGCWRPFRLPDRPPPAAARAPHATARMSANSAFFSAARRSMRAQPREQNQGPTAPAMANVTVDHPESRLDSTARKMDGPMITPTP